MKTIIGTNDFIESLRGKSASFLLALSYTKTSDIEGITQAGIPGYIDLTPVLDSEFLAVGEVRSMPNIAKTPKGVPTPALITRAVHLLRPFKELEFLDLGLRQKPSFRHFKLYDFDIAPSGRIDKKAGIKAKKLFKKGLKFAKKYELKSDYLILAESTPAGTTTAEATAKALCYKAEGLFSSSFKNSPNSIKQKTIKKALKNIKKSDTIFKKLSRVSDNMLVFYAGFVFGMSKRAKLILAGGTQMASLLLVINSIKKAKKLKLKSKNIALCTTKWVAEDKNSDIKALLNQLDFKIDAYYGNFDFSNSTHPALKLYDQGEAKEGVGAGASLVYAEINSLKKDKIIKQIESFLS
jgi:uncharacterized protein (TIGR00303 family)